MDLLEVIIPPHRNPVKTSPKIPFLKFSPKKEYTLILDLDETLINFKFLNINKRLGRVQLRPGLINFLEIIKEFYEIIIFTSGTKEYADVILNVIEKKGNNKYFDGRLYRNHNIEIGQKYYKDLSKIGRDLSKVIIIDNLKENFKLQPNNGIFIKTWTNDINDVQLKDLLIILKDIASLKVNDVRTIIQKMNDEIKLGRNIIRPYGNINISKLIGQ